MIDTEIRPMSHRETVLDYQNYVNKRKAIINYYSSTIA